ncbi:tetratricopeptide repeat protein 19, mitochondrial-like isoform X2 [Liolophura sinensis]
MSMKRAKLSQMRDDLVGAERYYHEALAQVNQKRAANNITEKDFLFAVTNINDCLAELALVQGQLDTADRLYKEVMKGCLQIGLEQTDNAIVELSIKLASIYAMQNKMAEARLGFQHAIQTQEKKMMETENPDENTKALLGLALESFSRFLMVHKEYDAAEKYLTKSYDLAKEVLGEEHPQTLVILNDLATIDIIKKKYSKAEAAVKKAIAVGERVKSPDVASFYCNLGAVHLRQDLHLEAKAVCTKARSMAVKAGDDAAKVHAERCLRKVKEVEEKQQKQKA